MIITNLLKILVFFLRTFTSNSATALPGVLLEDYFQKTLKRMLSSFDKVILVTGTNGKTTTTQMICHLLEQNDESFVTNKSGSNLLRGIAASTLDSTDFWGKPKSRLAVFEVEEGSMRRLVKFVKPEIIIVTNIFRDQLDAYGEIDKTYRYIQEAIQNADNPILILNGNDPRVHKLNSETTNKVIEVKLAEEYLSQIKIEPANVDPISDTKEIVDTFTVKNVRINDDLVSTFDIEGMRGSFYKNILKVPGLHNAINATCAIIGTKNLFEDKTPKLDLSNFEPAFGRGEIISVSRVIPESSKNLSGIQESNYSTLDSLRGNDKGGVDYQILLAKNPAGMNLNLHLLENTKNREAVLILLNDKTADGKDVSWIWDVNFDLLKSLGFKHIYVSGVRKYDLAVRLKYEGINVEKVFKNSEEAIQTLNNSNFSKVFVLPTYTAMLKFRKNLSKFTEVKEMWK